MVAPLIASNGSIILAGGLPIAVSTDALATTTLQSSVVHNGVTFTLNKSMPVGQFVTGEPFIVSTEAFQITATSPASADLNADGNVGNGMMQDPYIPSGGSQGFDAYLDGLSVAGTPYNDSLNVDPSKPSGSAISIALGDETSFVKTVRLASVTTDGEWQTFEKYAYLYVVPSVPFADSYPPSVSELPPRTYFRRSDVDTSVLRSLTFPGSWPSFATITSRVAADEGWFGDLNAEKVRRYRLDVALGTDSNYSGNYVDFYSQYLLEMHNAARTSEERQAIIDRTMRFGVHMFGMASRGWQLWDEPFQYDALTAGLGQGGAGQYAGPSALMFATAMLTRRSDLLAIVHRAKHKVLENSMWVDESFIYQVPQDSTGPTTRAGTAFAPARVGSTELINDEFSASYNGRYRPIGQKISGWEVLSMAAFTNGPGGLDGLACTLNGGAADTTNPRAAVAAMFDTFRSEVPNLAGTYGLSTAWNDAYDLIRPLSTVPVYTGPPSQPPGSDYFSAPADGAIRLNWPSGRDFATETVTQTDFRYSLDGRQWVVESDVTLSSGQEGTYDKTGLVRGAVHWAGVRRHSASGVSPWSQNAPITIGGALINRVTTTGTATAAAPSYVGGTAPAIVFRKFPQWYTEEWEATSDTEVNNAVEYAAGAGYIGSGYPAPTYTYAWSLDGTPTGDTDYKTTIEPHEARGLTLSCDVTATNASGNSGAQTASFTVPNFFGMPVPQGTAWEGSAATSDSRTIDIGTAHADRWLVAVIIGENSTLTEGNEIPGSLTIGGVSFTRVGNVQALRSAGSCFAQVWVSDAKIPTGTTATAAWSSSTGTVDNWDGFIYQIIKSTAPTVVDTASFNGTDIASGTAALTLDATPGGFLVGAAKLVTTTGGSDVDIIPDSPFSYTKRLQGSLNWMAVSGQHTNYTTVKRGIKRTVVAWSTVGLLVTLA